MGIINQQQDVSMLTRLSYAFVSAERFASSMFQPALRVLQVCGQKSDVYGLSNPLGPAARLSGGCIQ